MLAKGKVRAVKVLRLLVKNPGWTSEDLKGRFPTINSTLLSLATSGYVEILRDGGPVRHIEITQAGYDRIKQLDCVEGNDALDSVIKAEGKNRTLNNGL